MSEKLIKRLRTRAKQYMTAQLYDQASLLTEAADALSTPPASHDSAGAEGAVALAYCGNGACNWIGPISQCLTPKHGGGVICPDCHDTAETDVAHPAPPSAAPVAQSVVYGPGSAPTPEAAHLLATGSLIDLSQHSSIDRMAAAYDAQQRKAATIAQEGAAEAVCGVIIYSHDQWPQFHSFTGKLPIGDHKLYSAEHVATLTAERDQYKRERDEAQVKAWAEKESLTMEIVDLASRLEDAIKKRDRLQGEVERLREYITPALVVLRDMCRAAGLKAGEAKAEEMMVALSAGGQK